jgi:ABC-2 type transport system ATP-binding protein
MSQRLSLARTMIHDPQLLILDEPASGLDPRARIELRELLKELRALGKTIMISSHILTELAEMCTHIAIIEQGRLLASGDVDSILRSLQPHRTLEIRVLTAAEQAETFLRSLPDILDVRVTENQPSAEQPAEQQPTTLLVDYTGNERGLGELLAQVISQGIVVTRFAEQASDLEDIFMRVTKGII